MKAVLFIYKREDTVLVFDLEWSLKRHKQLIADGFKHISITDAAIMVQKIVNVLSEKHTDDVKIYAIKMLITE